MLDFTVDSAYTDRLSSINKRLGDTVIGNTSAATQSKGASTEDIQGLQLTFRTLQVKTPKSFQ